MLEPHKIILVTVLLMLSAFFSAAETAFTRVSMAFVNRQIKKGNKRAKKVQKIFESGTNFLSAILVSNNIINSFLSIIGAAIFSKFFDNWVIAGFFVTSILIIFGEIVPKNIAIKNADNIALLFATPVLFVIKILNPITFLLHKISSLFHKNDENENKDTSEEQLDKLRGLIDILSKEKHLRSANLLNNVLDFEAMDLSDIFIHRKNVYTIDIDLPTKEAIKKIINSPFKTILAYETKEDNIIGYFDQFQVIKFLLKHKEIINLRGLLQEPIFAHESSSVHKLIEELKKSKSKLAVIVDEFGGFMGISTLRLIIEEIMDIITAKQDGNIRKKGNSYIISGDMFVREINKRLGYDLDDEHTTINGLILFLSNEAESRLPVKGDVFESENFKFEIISQKNNTNQVKITKKVKKD